MHNLYVHILFLYACMHVLMIVCMCAFISSSIYVRKYVLFIFVCRCIY